MGFFKKKKNISEIEEDLINYNENIANDVLEHKERVKKGESSQKAYEKRLRVMHKLVYGE